MTAAKLFLLSCLVAVVGYFTYRELQVSTLGLVKKIHIPASGLMCSRNCSTILNFTLKSIHYGTYFHNREVSFEYLCPVVFKSHGSGASLTEEQNFSDPNLKCVTAHGIPSKNFC